MQNMYRTNRKRNHNENPQSSVSDDSNLSTNNSEINSSDSSSSKNQRDLLINILKTSTIECVICYEDIKNVEPIWSCRKCHQIIHLKCATDWYHKSEYLTIWKCPLCQVQSLEKPDYYCFCGTVPNPPINNTITPHSCGQICNQRRYCIDNKPSSCKHQCTLQCHPGPCPPCTIQIYRKCFCGKTRALTLCGDIPIECQQTCLKKLDCQDHVCQNLCHMGPCLPCRVHNQPNRRGPPNSIRIRSGPNDPYIIIADFSLL